MDDAFPLIVAFYMLALKNTAEKVADIHAAYSLGLDNGILKFAVYDISRFNADMVNGEITITTT